MVQVKLGKSNDKVLSVFTRVYQWLKKRDCFAGLSLPMVGDEQTTA